MRLLRTTGTLLCAAAAVLAASGCSFITGVRGTSRVTVTVSPDVIGLNGQAQAIGTAYDGDTPLSGNSRYAVTYTSRDPNVATVDQARGLVTGKAYGTTYIVAENRGSRDSAVITVRPVQAVQVVVGGSRTPTYRVGARNYINATALDANGGSITDRPIAWTARNTAVLTITNLGVISPVAVGSSWIVASIDNGRGAAVKADSVKADSVLATVTAVPVASVVITPNNNSNNTPTVYVGQTLQFTATLTDSLNNITTRPVTWSTNDNGRYTSIAQTGLATGVSANGVSLRSFTPTYVSATVDYVPNQPTPRTVSGTVAVAVLTAADSTRVYSSNAEVTTITVAKNSTTVIGLQAIDVLRNALNDRIFSLASSDPTVISVPATSSGSNTITAGPTAGTATLTVQALDSSGNGQGKKSTIKIVVQ